MGSTRPIAIVGPTASGKSDLAVALALLVGGEVVNADSMQLYRGMDIGTAKLPMPERRGVPHHLLDVLDVTERASVAAYQQSARQVIHEVRSRGAVPILVGGSGLYVRAVLDALAFPGTDPALRSRLEAELSAVGPAELHRRLAALDPPAAEAILPTNGRRLVRALEVIELTGEPFTARLPAPAAETVVDAAVLGLDIERTALDDRIAGRVDRMFEGGLVDEVRELERRGLRAGVTASRALGYRQVLELLDGARDEASARLETVRATRRFARRQAAWFRTDPRAEWLAYDLPDLAVRAAELVSAR